MSFATETLTLFCAGLIKWLNTLITFSIQSVKFKNRVSPPTETLRLFCACWRKWRHTRDHVRRCNLSCLQVVWARQLKPWPCSEHASRQVTYISSHCEFCSFFLVSLENSRNLEIFWTIRKPGSFSSCTVDLHRRLIHLHGKMGGVHYDCTWLYRCACTRL